MTAAINRVLQSRRNALDSSGGLPFWLRRFQTGRPTRTPLPSHVSYLARVLVSLDEEEEDDDDWDD